MTKDELDAIITTGKAELAATKEAQAEERKRVDAAYFAKADAAYYAQQKPGWKTSEFWLTLLSTLSGIGMSLAAAFGAKPQDIETAQQLVGAANQAAGQVAQGAESGNLVQGIVGGLLTVVPTIVYAVGRSQQKRR